MKSKPSLAVIFFGLALAAVSAALSSAAFGAPEDYSHVRIVRLSFVEGTVTIHRPDVDQWAAAPNNTPVQEGFNLATKQKSFAEVEFENTSTARLGQLSLMDFTQLAANSSGGKVNRVTLQQGYATFNVIPDGIEVFEVKALDTIVQATSASATRFRVDIDGGVVRVEVFKGAASVSGPYGQETLTKDMVAEIRPGVDQPFSTSRGISRDAWDQWVNERENQLSVMRNSPSPNAYSRNTNSLYGWNDLSNYGEWNYFPNSGYGWIPAASFGWSPFRDGRWVWYAGFGYTWISAEPWGWLPYHYGGWVFQRGIGWAWFPTHLETWSPANVYWSQGDGWVGWAPRPPIGAPGVVGTVVAANDCRRMQACGGIIVRPDVVREGERVRPSSIMRGVAVEQGRPVERLDVIPSRAGMLTGVALQRGEGVDERPGVPQARRIGSRAQVNSGSNEVVIGDTSGAAAAAPRLPENNIGNVVGARNAASEESGIVYDRRSGRYENSGRMRSAEGPQQVAPTVAIPEQAGPGAIAPEQGAPRVVRNAPHQQGSDLGNIFGAAPTSGVRPGMEEGIAPSGEAGPVVRRGALAPSAEPSHSEAPTYQPPSTTSQSPRVWGGARSNSADGDGSWSNAGARRGSGVWGASGNESGGGVSRGGGVGNSGGAQSGGGGAVSRGDGGGGVWGSSGGGGGGNSGGGGARSEGAPASRGGSRQERE